MKSTREKALFDDPPDTVCEEELLRAYAILQRKCDCLKEKTISLQSAMVLNTVYCGRLREQLAAQDEAKKRAKSNKRLMRDGLPCLLTTEEFVKRVEALAAAAEEKEQQRKNRKVTREEIATVRKEYEQLVSGTAQSGSGYLSGHQHGPGK
ncbi:hypothetical protein V5O48_019663 [Marasmius crinis-equi]|uniref:Uncharacterized protein n=1 Tax=Marasmius crinis-equi TaxID=585013 RepID=A0ABR3EHT6_9AGAR